MFRTLGAFIMAHGYDWAMQRSERLCLSRWRSDLVSQAQGRVLEIGAGTGLNLRHYPPQAELILSEPDPHMRRKLQKRLVQTHLEQPQMTDWQAASIDLPDNSIDTIVTTLVLCSVQDLTRSLNELYRVLKPGGKLLFLEHVIALKSSTIRWQKTIGPIWSCCCGNCQLTRDTGQAIKTAGFLIESHTDATLSGAPAIVARTIRGLARKPTDNNADITSNRNQDFDPNLYPNCPYCNSDRVGKFVYGKPALTRHILQGMETGHIISAGCLLQADAPQWFCQQCKKSFGQLSITGVNG